MPGSAKKQKESAFTATPTVDENRAQKASADSSTTLVGQQTNKTKRKYTKKYDDALMLFIKKSCVQTKRPYKRSKTSKKWQYSGYTPKAVEKMAIEKWDKMTEVERRPFVEEAIANKQWKKRRQQAKTLEQLKSPSETAEKEKSVEPDPEISVVSQVLADRSKEAPQNVYLCSSKKQQPQAHKIVVDSGSFTSIARQLQTFNLVYTNALATQSTEQLYGSEDLPTDVSVFKAIAAERAVSDLRGMYNIAFGEPSPAAPETSSVIPNICASYFKNFIELYLSSEGQSTSDSVQ